MTKTKKEIISLIQKLPDDADLSHIMLEIRLMLSGQGVSREDGWEALTAQQFFSGYSAADSIYDEA